jgi:hypothetical protein
MASGSARFAGSFFKRPDDSSAGSASSTAGILFRFETDVASTLFIETANEALLAGAPFRAPRWILNGNAVSSSGLNTIDRWSRELQAGTHELVLQGVSAGGALAERSEANGEFSTVFNWGIDSLPGTLPNPILPVDIDPGDFGFDIVTTETNRFYDPIIATGYDYVATDIPFASVLIPEALPNGDSEFQLLVGSETIDLVAGETFDLTTLDSDGIFEFGIRGIDTTEMLDPNDPTAFITGLSFTQGGEVSSFRMTAVTTGSNVVPEPSSVMAWSMLMGLGLLGTRKRKRIALCRSSW